MDSGQRHQELRERTETFALRIIRLYRALPRDTEAQVIGKQLLRSGTSVGANYCAAGRGRSKREFISKIGVVVEEADETAFWLRLLLKSSIVPAQRLQPLLDEANQLLAIFAASLSTARRRLAKTTAASELR